MTEYQANRYISILYRYSQRFFAQEFQRAGFEMGVGWLPTMMQVCRSPGITQDGISLQAGMDKGTVARAVKQMEEAGVVRRESDEADHRVNHIYPTQHALALFPRVREVTGRLHAILYEGLSDEEIEQTILLLERMKNNIAAHLEASRTESDTENTGLKKL